MQDSVVAYKFGPFELRPRTRELFRAGIRLRMRPQVLQVLALLAERAGDRVTREELHALLWSGKDFGDFEQGLNNTVRELRGVLGDSATEPVYIETLPRLGYRLIVPVEARHGANEPDAATNSGPAPAISASAPGALPLAEAGTDLQRLSRRENERIATSSTHKLRNALLGMAAVCALAAGTAIYWSHLRSPTTQAGEHVMVAVLPFANLTGDASQEYFSDGLTEELISHLGHDASRDFGVIARTSVMHYKNSHSGMDEIADALHVQYALEGSVRRDAQNLRVSVELVDRHGRTLWSREYDRSGADPLAIQSEIADAISGEIRTTLGKRLAISDRKIPTAAPAVSVGGYDFYLRGMYFLNKRNVEALKTAVSYFDQSIAKDPSYAPAYAGLSDCYALLKGYSANASEEYATKAKDAAQEALRLDPNLAEAHTAMALILQNRDWEWDAAEKEFQKAIVLNPNYATAHHWYAEHLAYRGRFDEAFAEIETARRVDPLSLIIATDRGVMLYYARRYDESLTQFESVRAMDPSFGRATMAIFPAIQNKANEESLKFLEQGYRSSGTSAWYWANSAYVNGRTGNQKKAAESIAKLKALNAEQELDPALFVVAYIGVGDNDRAVECLERALKQRSNLLTALKVDPIYDPLRQDERFKQVVRQIHLDR